jgi:hypothetical protein
LVDRRPLAITGSKRPAFLAADRKSVVGFGTFD